MDLGNGNEEREPARLTAAGLFDCLAHIAAAYIEIHVVGRRAGHGQHQRRRVAEILDEVDGAGALGQIRHAVQLELDIVELFARLLHALIEFHVDDGGSRAG